MLSNDVWCKSSTLIVRRSKLRRRADDRALTPARCCSTVDVDTHAEHCWPSTTHPNADVVFQLRAGCIPGLGFLQYASLHFLVTHDAEIICLGINAFNGLPIWPSHFSC